MHSHVSDQRVEFTLCSLAVGNGISSALDFLHLNPEHLTRETSTSGKVLILSAAMFACKGHEELTGTHIAILVPSLQAREIL